MGITDESIGLSQLGLGPIGGARTRIAPPKSMRMLEPHFLNLKAPVANKFIPISSLTESYIERTQQTKLEMQFDGIQWTRTSMQADRQTGRQIRTHANSQADGRYSHLT